MQVTTATLQRFVGGQMEIQNQGEKYLYRGEINTIAVEDDELRVTFTWIAKGEGFPPLPKRWVVTAARPYAVSLLIVAVSDIGPGQDGGNRISGYAAIAGELFVLYPPDGSKLDPAKVVGLQLPATTT